VKPNTILYVVSTLAAIIGFLVGMVVNKIFKRLRQISALRSAQELARRTIESIREGTTALLTQIQEPVFEVESISIDNFKNIQHLDLKLMEHSSLPGNWTCIVGINGAGKSTILQALCVVLLGERNAAELRSKRLSRMIRRTSDGSVGSAKIEARVRRNDGSTARIMLPLNADGIDETALRSDPDYAQMRQVWEQMKSMVLVSYGAARNLSEEEEKRHDDAAPRVRRQMTLFDPLTRIADVDVLVKSGSANDKKRRMLQRLLEKVISQEELGVFFESDRLVFGRTGTKVDAIDLPDGFRSTVAWLADLCAAWHDSAPEGLDRSTDPSLMTGIVLLDEIDLHLHPSMARSIVPKLRQALPRVQFVVTTHSPLVLSSFDRAELVVLEADDDGLVGTRMLDRQVFGFSMNEVYKWLMRTPPQSSVLEEKVARGDDPKLASYLYQAGGRSPTQKGVNEEEADLLVDDLERLLKEVKKDAGS